LPGGEPVLLSDTVGFIRRLPHGLVESFKRTLEVTATSDLLVHVVDSTAHDPESQIAAVRDVLGEIGANHVPELLVFNKADLVPDIAEALRDSHEGSVAISAATGEGVELMLRTIADRMRSIASIVELLIPYDRGDIVAAVHREGEVVSTSHEDAGIRVRARLAEASVGRLSAFVLTDEDA
jgi:GTP-binding protein HflX